MGREYNKHDEKHNQTRDKKPKRHGKEQNQLRDEAVTSTTGNSKPEGSVGGGVGVELTLAVAPFWPRWKAERMLEKMCIGSDLGRRGVVIGGENDQKRPGVDWRSAEWGSLGNFST